MEYTFLQKLLGFIILVVIALSWWWVMRLLFRKTMKFIHKIISRFQQRRKVALLAEINIRQQPESDADGHE